MDLQPARHGGGIRSPLLRRNKQNAANLDSLIRPASQVQMREDHRHQVDHRPREPRVLHEPDARVHVVRLLREEGEHPLEVPAGLLGLVLVARAATNVGWLQRGHVAGRHDRDPQGAAHDRQEPFRERLAARLHGQDGRDPHQDPPGVREEG